MPLPSPNLDDRTWQQLVDEERQRIPQLCPAWTDTSPSDPGIVLLDLFAYLTEALIYRLNRVPEKVYIELLNLLGVHRQPPAAAQTLLRFSRAAGAGQPTTAIDIPLGTRVTVGRSAGGAAPPVFVTVESATLPANQPSIDVLAYQCELVVGEPAGTANGQPGLTITVRRLPIIAPTDHPPDLMVGVEVRPEDKVPPDPALEYNGKLYHIWHETENFTDLGPDRFVYVLDRMEGTISFAPAARMTPDAPSAALAEVPIKDREIRLWYRRGGGLEGNVAADTLTTLKDPLPGVQVTNPQPASGGRDGEALANALVRGPQQFRSLERAVTARDFERLAVESALGAISRAKAFTRKELWAYAEPGTVEVVLVPDLPPADRVGERVTREALQAHQTQTAQDQVQTTLEERRPLGTACIADWAKYKTVRVQAKIVVRREENPTAVKQRVLDRLYELINPLPTARWPGGWTFGQALRASNVFAIALAEPGVRWIDEVGLLVDEVPAGAISTIAADPFQPHTWYAGIGMDPGTPNPPPNNGTLFRSLNDGAGWEVVGRFSGESITLVRAHPDVAGLLVVVTRAANNGGSHLYISRDTGESWEATPYTIALQVQDVAWTLREDIPHLLLATDKGLYDLDLPADHAGSPQLLLVDRRKQDLGFYTVTTRRDPQGKLTLAVAAPMGGTPQDPGGVYLSFDGGRTFRPINTPAIQGQDIRELAVQVDGIRAWLWAGAFSPGGMTDPGKGCFRWELLQGGEQDPPGGWTAFNQGWTGGSVRGLAFLVLREPGKDPRQMVLAASHHGGVARLDIGKPTPTWEPSTITDGLPLRSDLSTLAPVDTVAVGRGANLVLVGGQRGIFLSTNGGDTYVPSGDATPDDIVTLPETWLFVSGEHQIEVVPES